jgi:hypothetical protein
MTDPAIAFMAERDHAISCAHRELRYARQHRMAGEHGMAASCLEFAADSRDELARLLAEARGIARDGTDTTEAQNALVALMEE